MRDCNSGHSNIYSDHFKLAKKGTKLSVVSIFIHDALYKYQRMSFKATRSMNVQKLATSFFLSGLVYKANLHYIEETADCTR